MPNANRIPRQQKDLKRNTAAIPNTIILTFKPTFHTIRDSNILQPPTSPFLSLYLPTESTRQTKLPLFTVTNTSPSLYLYIESTRQTNLSQSTELYGRPTYPLFSICLQSLLVRLTSYSQSCSVDQYLPLSLFIYRVYSSHQPLYPQSYQIDNLSLSLYISIESTRHTNLSLG